jgi:hypothetical protein
MGADKVILDKVVYADGAEERDITDLDTGKEDE